MIQYIRKGMVLVKSYVNQLTQKNQHISFQVYNSKELYSQILFAKGFWGVGNTYKT